MVQRPAVPDDGAPLPGGRRRGPGVRGGGPRLRLLWALSCSRSSGGRSCSSLSLEGGSSRSFVSGLLSLLSVLLGFTVASRFL